MKENKELDLSILNIPEKELKILEAAVKIFEKKGFSATTTSEIAKEAGVAEGTIFRYFKTKKDILRGIVINVIKLVSDNIIISPVEKILKNSDDKDLRIILRELLYDRIKLVNTMFPVVKVVFTEAMIHDEVKETIYENIIKKGLEAFKAFHEKMGEKGLIRTDKPTVVLVRCVIANVAAYIVQSKIMAEFLPTRSIDEEVEDILDIILQGISPVR